MCKYKVGIDLDEVIWGLLEPWLDYYNQATNENIRVEDIKSYNLKPYVHWPETLYYILEDRDDLWEKVCLFDGVEESIGKLLSDKQIDLQIVTATSSRTANAKINRLFKLIPALKDEHITMTIRKDLLALDFMVDDYEENLKSDTIGFPILITKEYNKNFNEKDYGILRKNSLEDAVNAIFNIINQLEERG